MENYLITASEFTLFRDLIYKLAGICLNENKKHLVQSRLQKRLRHHGLARYKQYYDLVAACNLDHPEVIEFLNCITTNKTDFFREPHHFAFVTDTIVPEIERRGLPKRLRIWHAGCSTGEEPYTLSIALAEALGHDHDWDVRQLASDIDTRALEQAERGVFDREHVKTIPNELLKRYFLRGCGDMSGFVKVKPEVKSRIEFRRINLNDSIWQIQPGMRFDIVFCRNVVIYFDVPTQQKLFERFENALQPGGHLLIGHSESLVGVSDAFQSLGNTIYRLPERPDTRIQNVMAAA